MSFRDIDSAAAATEYSAGLNERWPARYEIMDEILAQISAMKLDAPHLLELCCGAGVLGTHLLSKIDRASYVGIDQSAPLLLAAQETLLPFAQRATLLEKDLNEELWHQELSTSSQKFDAIVSMQSLHDLGGEAEVNRIYRLAHSLVMPDGIFVNADLIVDPGAELPNNPGRLTIERHLALLTEDGFRDAVCVAEVGGFGVVVGRR